MKIKHLSIIVVVAPFAFLATSLAHAQSFTGNLHYGLQNNVQVTQLQEFLTTQGLYSGPITGNFYSLTLSAVKKFQTQQGIIPASGYFGPITIATVNKITEVANASSVQPIPQLETSTPTTAPSSTAINVSSTCPTNETNVVDGPPDPCNPYAFKLSNCPPPPTKPLVGGVGSVPGLPSPDVQLQYKLIQEYCPGYRQ